MQPEIYSHNNIKPVSSNIKKRLWLLYNLLFWMILIASIVVIYFAYALPKVYNLGLSEMILQGIPIAFLVLLIATYAIVWKYFSNRFLLSGQRKFNCLGKASVIARCLVFLFFAVVAFGFRELIIMTFGVIIVAIFSLYSATNRLIDRINVTK